MFSSLANFESQLTALLTILATSPTASSAPGATTALLNADDVLSSALTTLRTHQANYDRILRLRAEAASLEESIKATVKDVVSASNTARGLSSRNNNISNGESDDEGYSSSSESSDEEAEAEVLDSKSSYIRKAGKKQFQKQKEVDYRLLLDFARRISKYNHQAAADAANDVAQRLSLMDNNELKSAQAEVSGATGVNGEGGSTSLNALDDHSGLATVTKNATHWLDESAKQARQAYMIPYPSEDRIRMGLMAQLYATAGEGKSAPEEEAERLVRQAEGIESGSIGEPPVAELGETQNELAEKAPARKGSIFFEARAAAPPVAPLSRPRGTLDLDLYDPDEDYMWY